ncbi:apoptosis regulator R11 [Xenopus laevis]|uniref:Bcl-2-like protein 1 n=2 Tax=Xenopus laevis TaxID=8355 RepID=Q90ZH2_XENLA|nr:apoptosis regulator R11 [Xenopus laevis]XP_018092827.1 apoptosis regulator R11 [Xenopus laevis]OCT60365.1 hypothetical protein XELAEV_18046383mg [Xenopus laevis]BAB62748.1 Bcl-XL [Xenopus laevis]
MEGSSRDLVEKFVSKKLSQNEACRKFSNNPQPNAISNGTSTSERPGEGATQGIVEEEVLQALLEATEEFELRYQRAFSDLTSQLHITQDTAQQSFQQVMGELFRDGTNWGRIVAFFSFGRALCVESANKEMTDLLPRIVQWMVNYLEHTLQPWMQENGGWEAFVGLYGKNAAAQSRESQERFGRLLTIVMLTGVFALVCYMRRR